MAQKMFLEKEYEATSLNDVVFALGVAKGTVYHYLRNQTHIPAGHPLLDVIPHRFAQLRVEGVKTPPELSVAPAPIIPEVVETTEITEG